MSISELFSKYEDESNNFESVKDKQSNRPDLHAFILLDLLLPDKKDIVASAEHDEITLSIDCDELFDAADEEDILTLIRCGVFYREMDDCLCMFV